MHLGPNAKTDGEFVEITRGKLAHREARMIALTFLVLAVLFVGVGVWLFGKSMELSSTVQNHVAKLLNEQDQQFVAELMDGTMITAMTVGGWIVCGLCILSVFAFVIPKMHRTRRLMLQYYDEAQAARAALAEAGGCEGGADKAAAEADGRRRVPVSVG